MQRDLKSTERTSPRSAHEEVRSETTLFAGTSELQAGVRAISEELRDKMERRIPGTNNQQLTTKNPRNKKKGAQTNSFPRSIRA